MVSHPATSEAGAHAAGDTKSEHFEPARVRKLNEKQFITMVVVYLRSSITSIVSKVEVTRVYCLTPYR
jgi:hypothetical protein